MAEAMFTARERAPLITRRLLDRVTEMLHGLPTIRAAELTTNMLIQVALTCDDPEAGDTLVDDLARMAKVAQRQNFQRRAGTTESAPN